MQPDSSTYNIPSFAKQPKYNFDATTKDCLDIYKELNGIAEELEKCRLRNI